eukprot:CAMPEP_0119467394 /NCGR_PEP_ID=MMETSP1344-20130328/1600_1 /TAXON_ID=236787 /ORGANISM="Florenciella parvula, Strain CCMP2471" /LENGTH=1110 /DNA_ID=CAMNT_0007499755 /DNA_START=223 /DNA_END=3552 /DNA_ORIENTATION=-
MSATITPSDSGAAASAGQTPGLPGPSPSEGSGSRSLGRALSSTGDNSNTETPTVDGGSGFFARRSLLMQAGHHLIRPEDVQRLTANDRAILSTVLFIISAVPVGVFIVLFSAMSPLTGGAEIDFDPTKGDDDMIDKRLKDTMEAGNLKVIRDYGDPASDKQTAENKVDFADTLLKMYDLIFPVMMELSNTTDGNKTTYRDVLDGLDDAWPDGWKTTMSHMSYTTFRDEEYNNIGWQLVYFASMIFGVLWVCDADKWSSPLQKLSLKFLGVLFGGCVGTSMVVLADQYPYGPICLFIILFPAYLLFIYEVFLTHVMSARVFMGVIPKPLMAMSGCLVVVWLAWVNTPNNRAPVSSSVQKMLYSEAIGCPEALRVISGDMTDDYEYCTEAFLMWVFPVAMALSILAYGMLGYYLDEDAEHSLPKNLGSAVIFLLFLAWCTTSISIGATGITTAFGVIVICLLFAIFIMIIGTYGVEAGGEQARGFAKEMDIRYGAIGDWFKGFAIISMWPLALIYFGVSFVNQSVRKLNLNFSYPLGPEDKNLLLTKVVTSQIESGKKWEWTSVLYKGMIICELGMVMSVIVSKYTQVALSLLIGACRAVFLDNSNCASTTSFDQDRWDDADFWGNYEGNVPPESEYGSEYDESYENSEGRDQVTAWATGTDIFRTCESKPIGFLIVMFIVMCVGLFLFLLPPVPGVPIYVTGGIILIATGTQYDNYPGKTSGGNLFDASTENGYSGFLSIGESILACFVMSLSLKLFACTCQQMGFGYMLKKSVAVRQAVGVNTHMIRTTKIILRRPGLDVAKVAILVGGPDWPTSVLCGIVGLDLLPVLLGTIPVSVLIFPTILAGTFLYIGSLQHMDESGGFSLSFPWARTFTAVMLTVAAGVQTGSMFVAAYYLERAVNESGDELEAMPFDEEVERADALAKSKEIRYYEVRSWARLPTFGKVILLIQVFFMTICGYLVFIFGKCFRTFEVTNVVETDLRPIAQCDWGGSESEWKLYDGRSVATRDIDGIKAGEVFPVIDGSIDRFTIGTTLGGGQRCGYGDIMMFCYIISTVLFIFFGKYCSYLVAEDIKVNPLPDVVLDEHGRVVETTDGQVASAEAGAAAAVGTP